MQHFSSSRNACETRNRYEARDETESEARGCETIVDRVSDLNTFLGDYVGDVYVPPLT
jgi:hypothetical protein